MSRRLAPLSVPYRAVERGTQFAFGLVVVAVSVANAASLGLAGMAAAVALAGVLVLAVVGYEVAYYRRFSYELTVDTLDISSGVFARRDREIPLWRIQNVDIRRNAIQRALGIAAVSFETAGGSETEAQLRFVTFEEAKRLQREIARHKRGSAPEEAEPDREVVFELSNRELALVGALSFDMRLLGLVGVLLTGSVPVVSSWLPGRAVAGLAILGLAALVFAVLAGSWLIGAAVSVLNYYDFRLTRTADELQYERGLLRRFDGSIPLEKVQTLTISDNPLKRRLGYATLLIETAGYGGGSGSESSGRGSLTAVPIARRERVVALANEVEDVGDPVFERPPKRVRRRYAARYLIAIGAVTAVTYGVSTAFSLPVPWASPLALMVLAAPAAHLKWAHRGYWLGPRHVVTRNGVLSRETKLVPYDRVQTLIDRRTPFQRRWRLATLSIDTAGSLSLMNRDAAIVDVDAADANALRADLFDRTRAAVRERREERRRRRHESLVGPSTTGPAERPRGDGDEGTNERSESRNAADDGTE